MLRTARTRIFVLLFTVVALIGCTASQSETALEPTASTAIADEAAAVDATQVPPTELPATIAPLPTATTAQPAAEVVLIEPTATSESPEPFRSKLPILQAAPNITNETWINTEPLTLEGLRGKVVLIEFWTYG